MSGYSGSSYDRYVERTDKSTLHKMKETFWTTKQAVIQKLGKKEDVHVVASDAELDAKLEVFKAIQVSSMELLRVIEKYQDRLCALSQHENSMGRFLKSQSNIDKTRAGKMMAAVGKSQSFSAQQRLALRVPLVRLYQEVETFRYRAISDTLMTINRMEGARTEYRGALLWMKNVSEELDPDTYKQLEKFRKVQAQVKKTKTKFDKLKLDVMQKVDLLAASRCNMFSHVLANYQSALLHFWEKTSRTLTAVAESFKGYQYYEFSIIKELAEPSKQLAEKSSRVQPQRDTDEDFDPSNLTDSDDSIEERPNVKSQSESTSLIDIVTSSDSEEEEDSQDSTGEHRNHDDTSGSQRPQVKGVLEGDPKGHSTQVSEDEQLIDIGSSSNRLLELDEESSEKQQAPKDSDSMHNLYESETDEKSKNEGDPELFLEFEEDEDFDFTGKALPLSKTPASEKDKKAKDLLADDLHLEADDTGKDDMTILNEILNAPSTGEDDFTKEWQAVFGNVPIATGTTYTPVESDQSSQSAEFMPSNLLDMSKAMASMSVADNPPSEPSKGQPPSGGKGQQVKPKSKKEEKKDMSAWFNLFADLDPLSNPDAIGKKPADMTDA